MWTDATKLLGFMLTGTSQTLKFDKANPQIYNNKLIYIHENANIEIKAWKVIKIAFQQIGRIISAPCKIILQMEAALRQK